MAVAAWWRAWRWRISSTVHGGGNDDGPASSLQPTGGGSSIASSGTTTTYSSSSSTTTTTGSLRCSFIILQPSVVEVEEDTEEERMKQKLKHIEALVVSDRSGAPESWLLELKVDWVLHLAHFSSDEFISGQLLYLARSWIRALFEITKSISTYFSPGLFITTTRSNSPAASAFLRFFKATLSKMVPFVDAIVAVRTSAGVEPVEKKLQTLEEKLQALMLLRDALSTASGQMLSSCTPQKTQDLFPAEPLMAKVVAAIWDTMKVTHRLVSFMSSSSCCSRSRSTDIHPITRCLISYIKLLWDNYGTANIILHDAFLRGEPVPDNQNGSHVTNLTKEIIHSLEQLLTRNTHSNDSNSIIPWNKSLEFLFLINNLHFIHQQKQLWPLAFPTPDLTVKIDFYIKSYIQASWAPVMKCLHNPALSCFSGDSQLSKFEAYLQKTYDAQKQWKVPDPGMRKRIREAIIKEVIPGFTEFFKDNTLSNPIISPQDMETMLQELFEG